MYKDYESDCQLIDKLMIINAGINYQNPIIIKQAGIAEELGGAAQKLHQAVSERIAHDGIIATLLTYASPAVLSRFWWPLGVLPLIIKPLFGIDLGDFFKSIVDQVKSVITNTGDFTEADATQIANQSTSTLTSTASLDYFREFEKNGNLSDIIQGKIEKEGQYRRRPRSGNLFTNIWRSFGNSKVSKVLFGGVLRWLITSLLMGVALFEGPKVLFGSGKHEEESSVPKSSEESLSLPGVPQILTNIVAPNTTPVQKEQYSLPAAIPSDLKYSGKGNQYHVNSIQTIWLMDTLGSVENTLVQWAIAIYPELKSYQEDILNNQSFNRMVSVIYQVNPNGISRLFKMPPDSGLHTIKDVVDRFAGDVASKIKRQTNE